MNVTHPLRHHSGPPHGRPDPRHQSAPPPEFPIASGYGTMAALVGIALTALIATGEPASTLARKASIGALLSLVVSACFDLRLGGLRNLIRADLMAILAYYFLSLFEFLFPQPLFDTLIVPDSARTGVLCILLGFAGLLAGRHIYHPRKQPFSHTLTREIPAGWIVTIFWVSVFVGYVHMLIAVDFDFFKMIWWWMEARFTQPWGRGRLGDWKALLVELSLFIYLIPPLGGIIIARRHRYGLVALTSVLLGLLLTFFYGFTSGTRYIFAAYLVTFLIGYAFALPFARRKELLFLYGGSAVLMIFAFALMLQFRNVGLRAYLDGNYELSYGQQPSYFVDYNLYNISRVMEVFPSVHDFLGWEIPYNALIRPIPRAIWKGKPEGLSTSIEDTLGVEGFTIAVTFAGEAYMSGGFFVVGMVGVFFGALTGWWSHLASPRNSELGILIYASGFFATVISMRSLFVFTTSLLPTVAALIIGAYAAKMLKAQAQRLIERMTLRDRAQERLRRPGLRPPGRPPK